MDRLLKDDDNAGDNEGIDFKYLESKDNFKRSQSTLSLMNKNMSRVYRDVTVGLSK